jgi:hypothetical protein
MATFNKFNNFVQYLGTGVMNLTSDTVKVMLTNTAPVATNNYYGDISSTELANGNGYTTGGATVTGTGWTNSSGTSSYAAGATTWTSVTGSMGPFRYVVYYDSTPATNKPLIGWYDYGSALTLNGVNGDTFTTTPATNLFTIV